MTDSDAVALVPRTPTRGGPLTAGSGLTALEPTTLPSDAVELPSTDSDATIPELVVETAAINNVGVAEPACPVAFAPETVVEIDDDSDPAPLELTTDRRWTDSPGLLTCTGSAATAETAATPSNVKVAAWVLSGILAFDERLKRVLTSLRIRNDALAYFVKLSTDSNAG